MGQVDILVPEPPGVREPEGGGVCGRESAWQTAWAQAPCAAGAKHGGELWVALV